MILWLSTGVAVGAPPVLEPPRQWLLEEEIWVQVKPPLPVGWTESLMRATWVVDWTPGEPTWSARLCGMDIEPVMGAQTTWPEATVAAMPSLPRPVSFDGTTFVAGPVVESIGAGDDDEDGNPGVTIEVAHPRIGGGEVWVRHTTTARWTGQMQSDGTIVGTLMYEPEQEQLGATTWWLRMGLKQRASKKSTSRFVMTPVAPGVACSD